jgi:phosphoglycerate dehydrogenase-like enzyme
MTQDRHAEGTHMKVAVLDDYQGVALSSADWRAVTAQAAVVTFREHLDDESVLADRLRDVGILVLMRERTPVTARLLESLPGLRLIVTTGPSNASVDVNAARARGIVICGTSGYTEQTVELTWALILGLARHIAEESVAVRSGGWQVTLGTDLFGKTLGIVGLGRIGLGVARVATAFGMHVLAWSENLSSERAAGAGCVLVGKEELFRRSDIVSLHLVLSERSAGIVGRAELAAMKPSALLVNTSRGPLVDEQALIDALTDGAIAGAGLDVFSEEPLPPDHPFRSLPNVLATPHIGYVTTETYDLFFREVVEDITAFLQGAPIREVP